MLENITGNSLRRRRRALDITQKELAEKIEIGQSFLSQIENDLKTPSLSTAYMLHVILTHLEYDKT